MKKIACVAAVLAALLLGLQAQNAVGDDIQDKYKPTIEKGLQYLVKMQFKDGHWGANGDQYPVSMTGLAGMAMLMEGSTIREGKYATNIRRAADWLMERSMKGNNRDGLIGNPDHPTETGRYMYGHGFGTLFLALVYGDEEDRERREKLKDILTRAVKYIGNAQSTHGGWFYTSKADGHDQDEGSVTITQLQPLRACRNAGIAVPKHIIKKGYDYLKNSTTPRGGVVYSLGRGGAGAPVGGERPALTAAAIACLFSAGEYKDELVKKWFKYCQTAIPISGAGRIGHDEYTHLYYAQALYVLGDDGWDKMFPGSPADQRMTWSEYRKNMFDRLVQTQNGDGSWPGGGGFSVGPVYSTAIYCMIMQLDRGAVPFFQR
ncbi:MAG: terpene cyclase/mutase family protein [Gemmataceae bacterium]|nr:terpene cyclase/mutase family protein [Gemmataceae bacterium]MCI0740962.1 terpene cyclase/mutase family protein [Gemmataceae bacterium]